MKKGITTIIIAIFCVSSYAGTFVRFESGKELEIRSWHEENGWIIFELAAGGELGIECSRVKEVGETEKGKIFIVTRHMMATPPSGILGGGVAGGTASADARASQSALSPSWGSAAGGLPLPATEEAETSPDANLKKQKEKEKKADAGPASISISAPANVFVGETFTARVALSVVGAGHTNFYVRYPKNLVDAVTAQDLGALSPDGNTYFMSRIRIDEGLVVIGFARQKSLAAVNVSGEILHIQFKALAAGQAGLFLEQVNVLAPDLTPFSVTVSQNAATEILSP